MATKQQELLLKIIIIGDSAIGKTNILVRFCEGNYKDSYVPTIGVDFKVKTITMDDTRLKFQIWDTAGQERYRQIVQTYYKGASGVILAYSITDRRSFENVGSWMAQIGEHLKDNVPKILIGNKCDDEEGREVKAEEGEKLAKQQNLPFLEVSAKDGIKISDIFNTLGRNILQNFKKGNTAKYQHAKLTPKGTNNQGNCAC